MLTGLEGSPQNGFGADHFENVGGDAEALGALRETLADQVD